MSLRTSKSRRSASRSTRSNTRQRLHEPEENLMTLPPEIRNTVLGHLPLADQMQLWHASQATQGEMHSNGTFDYTDLASEGHVRARGVDMFGMPASLLQLPTWGLSSAKFNTLHRVDNIHFTKDKGMVFPPHLKQLSIGIRHSDELRGLEQCLTVRTLEVECVRDWEGENTVANLVSIIAQLGRLFPAVHSLRVDYSVDATDQALVLNHIEVEKVDFKDVFARHFAVLQTLHLQASDNDRLIRLVLPASVHTFNARGVGSYVELQQDPSEPSQGTRLQNILSSAMIALDGNFPALSNVDAGGLFVNRQCAKLKSLAFHPSPEFPIAPEFFPSLETVALVFHQGSLDFLRDFSHLSRLDVRSSRSFSVDVPLRTLRTLILNAGFPDDWERAGDLFPRLEVFAVRTQTPQGRLPRSVTKACLLFRDSIENLDSFCQDVLDTLDTLWLIGSVPVSLPPFRNLRTLCLFPSLQTTVASIPESVTRLVGNRLLSVGPQSGSLQMEEQPRREDSYLFRSFAPSPADRWQPTHIEDNSPFGLRQARRLELDVHTARGWTH